ncbi:MAG: DUF1854 domain-containing protein [Fimbriimonadales bacterium]
MEIAGRFCLLGAKLRRCFPLTHSDSFIAVFDGEGNEIGIIPDLAGLETESRKAIDEELDAFYFTPAIERIKSLKAEASMWKWEVDTQRGLATFYLRGVRDSVHEVAPGRWQVFSVDGQRYEITNLDGLDQRSQNLFEGLF